MLDQDQNSSEVPHQSSQFVGGLVMGLVLGTAGYYFFGTPEGKKQRQVLLSRWDKFKAEAMQTSARPKSDLSDILHSGLKRLAAEFGLGTDWQPRSETLSLSKPTQQSKKALVSPKFKPKSTVARAKFHGT